MKKFSKCLFNVMIAISTMFLACFGLASTNKSASATTSYSIGFNANGGQVEGVDFIYKITNADGLLIDSYGNPLTELPVPTNSNKSLVFAGWYSGDGASLTQVFADTVFTSNTNLTAIWLSKSFEYTISSRFINTDLVLDIIGKTTTGSTYNLAKSISSITEALNLIYGDLTSSAISPVVNFDDIHFVQNETITLTQNIIVTGNIISDFNTPIFNLASTLHDSNYVFNNCTIESQSNKEIIKTTATDFNSNVKLENVTFIGPSNDTYAIFFDNENHFIELFGNNSHTTDYLFNFTDNLTIQANSALTNPISKPIYIQSSKQHDGKIAIDNLNPQNIDRLDFKSNSLTYNIFKEAITETRTYIKTHAVVNFIFDLNGGNFSSNYIAQDYHYTLNKAYPIADDLEKQHYVFEAWFGKIVFSNSQKDTWGLNNNTYYFDSNILKSFKESGYDTNLIDELFKTSINDFDSNNSFKNYSFEDKTDEKTYLICDLAEYFEIAPTLIARWSAIQYSINFDTDGGDEMPPLKAGYGEIITAPIPTKTGYSFVGWFTSKSSNVPYVFTTMPSINIYLIAKWEIADFTVTFKSEGVTVAEITQTYKSQIEVPPATKTGHKISSWIIDGTTTEFDFITPGQNIIVNAVWEKEIYYLFFNTNPANKPEIDATILMYKYEYGTSISLPENPVTEGHEFLNWYKDKNFQNLQTFPFIIEQSTTLYANWKVNQYKITFNSNGGSAVNAEDYYYATKVNSPTPPNKQGFIFSGWFTDEALQTQYFFNDNTKMEAKNFTLYAKWVPKTTITLNPTKQTSVVNNVIQYSVDSVLGSFVIEYKIDDVWSRIAPSQIGIYDVRISRAEDANYNSFVYELKDGFEIINKTLDLDWVIALLFVLLILEIIAIIFIKHLQKTKKIPISTFSLALPIGIITTKQLIIVCVLGGLVLLTFIYMVYQLIKLHKISTEEISEPSIYNVRHTIEKMGDHSEDIKIANSVDELLEKEGFKSIQIEDDNKIDDDNDIY